MFDYVRKHTTLMMGGMFLLVIPAFVLVGINGYLGRGPGGKVVASVAGTDITEDEWDAAHKREADRIRASMPSVDPKLLDSPAARYGTLERLVRERVLATAADKERLYVSDARLATALHDDPNIAALRRPDGTLDMEVYRQLLANQGMTPAMFESRVRADLSARQVMAGVTDSAFVSKPLAEVALSALFERREVQIARFSTKDHESNVKPTDAEIEAYYDAHKPQFQAPESADVEYVALDLDTVKKGITISEADLKSYYDQNAERFNGKPERRASHILITVPRSASAADRAKAKAQAEALLVEARKPGADFAELARKHSQDPGSAAEGGDLGFFTRGAMVKPFEDAAFALAPGQISDVVESDFGYHIIKLTDLKTPKQRPFDEVRPEIEDLLKTQQAQRKFAEEAETFSNAVYEQPDSLKPVADRLKLEIRTAQNVLREPPPNGEGALANPRFLAALFSDDTLRNKRNTEAIDLGANRLAAGRVVRYSPAHTLPLAEVREAVRERLIAERAAELAKKEGVEKLAQWKADPSKAKLGPAVSLSRDQPGEQPPAVVDAALLADASALPTFVGVDLGAQGYAVLKVLGNTARATPGEAEQAAERQQYVQSWMAAQTLAYYDVLRQKFDVQIKVPRPASVARVP